MIQNMNWFRLFPRTPKIDQSKSSDPAYNQEILLVLPDLLWQTIRKRSELLCQILLHPLHTEFHRRLDVIDFDILWHILQ
mmetsp:Transcript_36861/g.77816  ORF Transcript_36861/g.77816 Transcript_36861/m.77816 type:complete len:80 (+) Transcript_36861:92-331(+)